jgi:Protein of unknown function (DUF2934)
MFDDFINLLTPAIPPFAELPDDDRDLRDFMERLYLSDTSVARVAYSLWERDGRPDGDKTDERFGIKLKDLHWWRARMMLDVVLDTDFATIRPMRDAWKERCMAIGSV